MVITLSGVTGVGKSYFKKEIEKKLKIESQVIMTTRKKRKYEIDGIDKKFVSKKEFEKLRKQKEIVVAFEFLGNYYGYPKEQMEDDKDSIVELHYSTIYQLKKEVKNTFSIYIIPKNIEMAKEELRKRTLPKKVQEERLKEIEEHINNFNSNENLRNQFDYILYNDYTEKPIKEIEKIIKEKCSKPVLI